MFAVTSISSPFLMSFMGQNVFALIRHVRLFQTISYKMHPSTKLQIQAVRVCTNASSSLSSILMRLRRIAPLTPKIFLIRFGSDLEDRKFNLVEEVIVCSYPRQLLLSFRELSLFFFSRPFIYSSHYLSIFLLTSSEPIFTPISQHFSATPSPATHYPVSSEMRQSRCFQAAGLDNQLFIDGWLQTLLVWVYFSAYCGISENM